MTPITFLIALGIALFCLGIVVFFVWTAKNEPLDTEDPEIRKELKEFEDIPAMRLHPDAILPKRNNRNDVGLDIYAIENVVIPKGQGRAIPTGIALELPINMFAWITNRSSMGLKGFNVHGGIVDEPYRGELKVILYNHSGEDQIIEKGHKIAQIIVLPAYYANLMAVDNLSDTERGDKGFGSSGK